MSRRPARYAGFDELLIDGHNLLHRTAGSAAPAARHSLLARLRATLPAEVLVTVVLDGPPDPGGPMAQRISPRLAVRHSGRQDADGLIVALVQARPFAARARVAVVSDDRALRDRVRRVGGATRRLSWLTDAWPAEPRSPGPGDDEEAEREPWTPGRGATTKRGNPRRASRERSGRDGERTV